MAANCSSLSRALLVSSFVLALGACGSTDSAATPDSGVSIRADAGQHNVGGDAASTLAPPSTSNATDAARADGGPDTDHATMSTGDVDGGRTTADAAVNSCGDLGLACCTSNSCTGTLQCLAGTTCSCAAALFGRYVMRADGHAIYEADPPATEQIPVLEADANGPIRGTTAVMEGSQHGCALNGSAHTLSCWRTSASGNSLGQLGVGTTDTSGPTFRATNVLTGPNMYLSNVITLSSQASAEGGASTCVTTLFSNLLCWGDVTWLANGGTAMINPYATAITTDGTRAFTGAVQTAIGEAHACAVVQKAGAKEVWCWGHNSHGQLGVGHLETERYPVKVAGLSNPTKVIVFGKDDDSAATCVLDDGKVFCFGNNGTGQLGQGSTGSPVLTPKLVTRMGGAELSGVVDIVGGSHGSMGANVCALLKDHTLLCWGKSFSASPTPYGPSNVASLGNIDGGLVRFLTSDGQYHVDTSPRTLDCREQG